MTIAPLLALLALAGAADPTPPGAGPAPAVTAAPETAPADPAPAVAAPADAKVSAAAAAADAKVSAVAASADEKAAAAGAVAVPPAPIPPAPGADFAVRTAALEQPAAAPAPRQPWYAMYDGTHLGLQLDLGAPDISGLSLVFRPYRFLRLEAGGNFNVLSGGLHGGVTLLPFHWGVVPTLHFEYGQMFDGDASKYAPDSSSAAAKIALKQIGYAYQQAQLGLEFGAQNRFVFFLRGGLFWLQTEAKNFKAAADASNPGAVTSATNPQISVRGPSVNLGFLLYLF
ncbi:hypothetical protein [Anaeromyxobacter paludicola]|uniref:Outer membrane protein beta-barrel domain-containing protein n=1 Tax=Anaeromyxobacter paludicola TaxID=2918171 RepID=A0ABN6NBN6_9BACT|nr:hypothetical protein [Anaeromyxobacter paludicola]BDG10639.1 hypothetical protein AMPC_37520 [Anaeromyxobacter paludicola]